MLVTLLIVFQSLTSSAESKLVKDFRLTKFAAGLCKHLNRYKNILPCKSAFYTVRFSKRQFGLQKNTHSLDDQSLVLLGREWPRAMDDPEPELAVS